MPTTPAALAIVCILAAVLTIALAASPSRALGEPRAPELEPNLGWLNTDRPLRLKEELKGHVVLLDFWTYCCINCMHVLPDLAYLEEKYKDEPFIVVGVHSAKFQNEAERQSIRNAVFRYDIHHPVVIDRGHDIWNRYAVRGWPTFVLIDPEGYIVGQTSGEGKRELLDGVIAETLKEHREKGTLARTPFRPVLDAAVPSATGLSFPGKIVAHPPEGDRPGRLFIADSSHHRVVVATYPDRAGASSVLTVYGTGEPGFADGASDAARFHDPQGLAFDHARGTLYVADTKNHAVRVIDLRNKTVSTLVGNGKQSHDRRGGKAGAEQGLGSPWDLALAPDGTTLYIAMAGPHQLWRADVRTGVAERLAGSGAEDIDDGPAERASLAQPSGLALSGDGTTLYFADSETSAVRALDLDDKTVRTIIGTGLFDFGDVDGAYPDARLQHPLGVTRYGDELLVADTYNHKIKLVDPRSRTTRAWLGAGRADPGERAEAGDALRLDEPGGLHLAGTGDAARLFIADTNNHRVVVVDPVSKAWHEVTLAGLGDEEGAGPVPEDAVPVTVSAAPGKPLTLALSATLPAGRHPNPEAPLTIRVVRPGEDNGPGAPLVQRTLRAAAFPVRVEVPAEAVAPGAALLVELSFASCTDGNMGVCVPNAAAWLVTLVEGEGGSSSADLSAPAR